VTAYLELAVLGLADVVAEAELEELLEVERDDTEAEGQEKMLELAVDGLVPELVPLEDNEVEVTLKEADIADGSAIVVVVPKITCVTIYVAIERPVEAAALLGTEEGFGRETAKPPLEEELPGIEEDDAELPELAVGDGG
jgi:hypothetical protein